MIIAKSPRNDDIMLVRAADTYSLLRSTGVGMAARRRFGDPGAAMSRPLALAVAHALAFTTSVAVWVMDDGPAILVETNRAGVSR